MYLSQLPHLQHMCTSPQAQHTDAASKWLVRGAHPVPVTLVAAIDGHALDTSPLSCLQDCLCLSEDAAVLLGRGMWILWWAPLPA